MTIKQQGGVFGRNPTFNDVTIEGDLEIDGTLKFDGDIDINSDLKVNGDLEVLGQSALGATIPSDAHATWSQYFVGEKGSVISEKLNAGGLFGMWLTDNVYIDNDTGNFAYLTTDEASAIRCEAGEIEFRSAPSGTAGAAMTLTQYAKFTTAGNLAFVSGKGIDFSATSDAPGATSELLDDYEEGTWTPAFSGGDYTFTYNRQKGSYTKIGNRVFIDCVLYVHPTTAPSGTVDGNLAVIGLPYAHDIQNDVDVVGGVAHFKQLFMSGIETLAARLATGNVFVFYDTLATNYPELAYVQASDVAANTRIRIQFSYPTNG